MESRKVMRKKLFKQIFSFLLCVVLTISLVPGAVVAADTSGGNGSFVSETHDVFQHTESTLAPGVEQYTNYAYAKDGKQMVYYVATADISRDDVVVQTSYLKQHENGVMGIDLNNMSRWELDHMRVAPGFTATYTVQDDENIATIVITRTGKNDTVGEGTLVSMPIRTWELKTGYTYESGTKNGKPAFTYKQFRDMKEFWPVDISMEIDRGLVTFVDGTTDTFSGEGPQVDTESYKMAKDMISTVEGKAYYDAWDGGHIHTAAALPDQAATCTEDGYTGRTYCESCNFVVNWGTAIPAGTYLFGDDGVLVGPGDAAVVASGSCGENATWTLYDSGKLEIGGTGAVSDYGSQLVTPWVGYRDQIKSIEIGAGITSIGRYVFSRLYACTSITFAEGSKLEKIEVTGFYYDFQVTSVVLPETVRSIGVLAFANMYGLTDLYVPQGVSMIGDNAFRGSRQVTLSVAAGSYAELYAVNQNIAHISRDK